MQLSRATAETYEGIINTKWTGIYHLETQDGETYEWPVDGKLKNVQYTKMRISTSKLSDAAQALNITHSPSI